MTNEERSALIAQGWTPPVAVDPDLIEARDYAHYLLGTIFEIPIFQRAQDYFLQALKRGRALAAAEAKPGLVWVKHDGGKCPVSERTWVWAEPYHGSPQQACDLMWPHVTHYAIITRPEDAA